MKENSIEEDIEILENAIECNEKQFEEIGVHIILQDDEQKALEHILSEYSKLQKENEKQNQLIEKIKQYLFDKDMMCDFLKREE